MNWTPLVVIFFRIIPLLVYAIGTLVFLVEMTAIPLSEGGGLAGSIRTGGACFALALLLGIMAASHRKLRRVMPWAFAASLAGSASLLMHPFWRQHGVLLEYLAVLVEPLIPLLVVWLSLPRTAPIRAARMLR